MKLFKLPAVILVFASLLIVVLLFYYFRMTGLKSAQDGLRSNTSANPMEMIGDANDSIHTYLDKLIKTFNSLAEDNLEDRFIISSKIEQIAFMSNQENQLTPGNLSIEEFDKLTAVARNFWKIFMADVTTFENNLTFEEIKLVTSTNPNSRFRLAKKLCTRVASCDECTESEFDKLFLDDPSLSPNRFILVALINSAKEDKFKPEYFSKLLEIAKTKHASKYVNSYYNYIIKNIDRTALIKNSNDSYVKHLKELQLYEPKRSLKETEDYASNILIKSPNCAHYTIKSSEFAQKRAQKGFATNGRM